MDFSVVTSFVQSHPMGFVAALLGQLLFVILLAILYIRKGKNFKIPEVITLIITPAISAFAFVYVTFLTINTAPVGETRTSAAVPTPTPIRLLIPSPTPDAETLHILFRKVPTTIASVTAEATPSGQSTPVASGSAASYASLTFTWPAITSTSQVQIAGYHVSFGIKDAPSALDPTNGIFTGIPTFTASNLQKGKTYELRIWARLSVGASFFLKPVELPGKQTVLFTYTYQ